jgi:hypothetical protein
VGQISVKIPGQFSMKTNSHVAVRGNLGTHVAGRSALKHKVVVTFSDQESVGNFNCFNISILERLFQAFLAKPTNNTPLLDL